VRLGDDEELMYASLAVGENGTIDGGTKAGRLYAWTPDDGSVRWSLEFGHQITDGAAIGAEGTIYVISPDGMLHAIRELEENNGGFDASPWPVWRGNRQNTGRAGS